MGGCQNYGPFLGPYIIRHLIFAASQKGAIILTTTHMGVSENWDTLFGGPYNKDPTIQGAILGSPIFGNSLNPKPLIEPL